ncbi:mechanosensitive ion channel family protein [Chryseobacterium sp.]|uniref:mechanosensitive ion channel family protein n=1 Tax=Chryseobacterium sp. TaxID=1871047 RepID=UPI0011C702EA|nr:mechanosensitive ion channel family protein [Chryseobacterium sp.]TXF74814.1 mechanosensitive ion channel family protein [Chryseobacterium sp.]
MESTAKTEAQETEAIHKDHKVQRELNEFPTKDKDKKGVTAKENASAFVVAAIIFVVCGGLYYLLGWKYFPIQSSYIPLIQKVVLVVMFILFVLVSNTLLKKLLTRKIENAATAYNLRRIADLFSVMIIFAIVLTLLFANWYATLVSFGIVSLILGFALQNPITSFFAWIYILIRKPYEVGDRIRIGNVFGDVINVSYIDTTLWEFHGDYLSGDHPSGRIIKFANSKVFSEYVYNYSWPLFPFLWNELQLFVCYGSDLQFTGDTVKKIVQQEIGEAMIRRVQRFKNILADTPVDELEVKEYPSIILRAHDNAFVEVTVRYLVEPKNSGRVKTKLFGIIMEELGKFPDKVQFPQQNMP